MVGFEEVVYRGEKVLCRKLGDENRVRSSLERLGIGLRRENRDFRVFWGIGFEWFDWWKGGWDVWGNGRRWDDWNIVNFDFELKIKKRR